MTTEQRPIDIQDAIGHRVPDEPRISPDGTQVVFSLGWASKVGKHPTADLWLAATDGSFVRRLTTSESNDVNPQWSPDGVAIAFISDREQRGTGALYLISPNAGEAVRISTGDARLAEPRWSPDGQRIAIKATDPKSDEDKQREEKRDDVIVHGEREKLDRLCVVDVPAEPFSSDLATVAPQRLIDGNWHIWEHAWSPDGTCLAVTIAEHPGWDEAFDRVRLALVPATGGTPSLVGADPLTFRIHPILRPTSLAWSPSGDSLAFLAAFDPRRDAGEAVYILDVASGVVSERFNDEEGSVLAVAWPRADVLFVLRLHGVRTTFWTLPRSSGTPEIATGAPLDGMGSIFVGWQSPSIAGTIDHAGEHFSVVWSDATRPLEVWSGDLGGGEGRQLTHVNAQFAARSLGRTEIVRWAVGDGQEIEGLLLYPVDYKAGTRYPTILHVHGGPSWAWDDHFYANWHDWGQLLAGRGYAVLMPNPRGSTGRGWQFQVANWNDWMGADYRDSQQGIEYLIERGIADPERLGVGGWSYGGLTTAWVLTQTNRYKAGIVGAGVTNRVSMQHTTDIIRWAGSWMQADFAESPDAFWQSSAIRFIGQVTTPTLVLHGENDERVPVSQGWEYYNALRYAGGKTTIAVYPREPHGIEEYEHQRDLLERVVAWFDEHVR